MRIEVTAEHVKRGERQDGRFCPVALALKQEVPGLSWFAVDEFAVECEIGISLRRLPLPEIVTDKIQAFDATGQMEPFSFELPIEATP